METLRSSNRLVRTSTPILAEDSTPNNLALSLVAVFEQLGEEAERNDYLVGLLLVLLAESGFRVSSHLSDAAHYRQSLRKDDSDTRQDAVTNEFCLKSLHPERTGVLPKSADNSSKVANNSSKSTNDSVKPINHSLYDQNMRIVYIPQNWKLLSPFSSEAYETSVIFNNIPEIVLKLIVIPWNDKSIVMFNRNSIGKKKYMIIETSRYVARDWTDWLYGYTNLKEISHKFKDALVTPVRTDILSSMGLKSPSLQSLPTELLQIISDARLVCITTPILAEDSTHNNLALSLMAVLEQLGEKAERNDYLVGLLLVLLAESGFRASSHLSDAAHYRQSLRRDDGDTRQDAVTNEFCSKSLYPERSEVLTKSADNSSDVVDSSSESTSDFVEPIDHSLYDQNPRIVYIPQNWKSLPSSLKYDISLIFNNVPDIVSKLVVKPIGDKLLLNMYDSMGKNGSYCLLINTLKYVNPYSTSIYRRYMNLKEISHRFKDALATRVRTDILSSVGLKSPSLQGLPTELVLMIIRMLGAEDSNNLALCSIRFHQLCPEQLRYHCRIELPVNPLRRVRNTKCIYGNVVPLHMRLPQFPRHFKRLSTVCKP